MSSLVERLLAKKLFPYVEGGNTIERIGYVNPDGPEAANEIERLAELLTRAMHELEESDYAHQRALAGEIGEALSLHKGGRDGD